MTRSRLAGAALALWGACASISVSLASDWPMWRGDAARSRDLPPAAAPATELQWSRDLGAPAPAWPASQDKLRFDESYEPVALGRRLFVPSMVNDSMTAYDTRTGAELWRFVTGGPVRFAGVAFDEKVCFGSDDGYLYCVDASTGELRWRRRGGPAYERLVIGNERLISTWAVRGAPVLCDGKIYFAAGFWPFMGVFIHCLDAATGEVVWTNSGTGSRFTTQQHSSPAFAGVAPQGYLAATEELLLVAGGRTVPAALDRRTGKLRYFHLSSRALGKAAGGYDIRVTGDTFSLGGRYTYRLSDGKAIKGEKPPAYGRLPEAVRGRVLGELAELADGDKPWRAIYSDDRLFVTTRKGKLLCFGGQATRAQRHALHARPRPSSVRASSLSVAAGAEGGWCLVLGLGDGELALDLAASGLDVVALDPDEKRVDSFRRRAIAYGLYGRKVSALVADPAALPPYFANIVAFGDASVAKGREDEFLSTAFGALRPYGGSIVFSEADAERLGLARRAARLKLPGARVEKAGDSVVLRRHGPLAGAGSWTHQNADAANSLVSSDDLVRAPMGLLWFGGPANDEVLPRHGHGPAPQVAGGRIFIEGRHMLRAIDVYTGRLLWQRRFTDLGKYYDHTSHHPGANEIGGNYVSLADGVYVKMPRSCVRLDPATGATAREYTLPAKSDGAPARWGFVMATGDLLVAAASPVAAPKVNQADRAKGASPETLATVNGKYSNLLKKIAVEKDRAGEGEFSDYGYWDATSYAGHTDLPAGYWVYVYPHWYIFEKAGRAKGPVPGGLTTIVKPGETWRYLSGSHPDGPWIRASFRDDEWRSGAAGFGYGDGDDRTVIKDMQGKSTVVYARKTFEAPEGKKIDRLYLLVRYDDAFVAYLNGTEVVRAGVGKGSGRGASRIESHEAGETPERFEVPGGAALLRKGARKGANVLAIEGHNTSTGSSDFTLDPYLAYSSKRKDSPGRKRPDLSIARALVGVDYSSASRSLVAIKRSSGRILWSREAAYGFRHNAVVAGGGRVYCVDGMSAPKMAALRFKGVEPKTRPALYALDARTGRVVWRSTDNVFGTWLAYSEEHDILVQAGKPGRDNAKDESRGRIVAHRGADGRELWAYSGNYTGPVILWGDRAVANNGFALDIKTGREVTRTHPMSGERVPWRWRRMYGCNHAIGSRHALLFRSAAAGYYDLAGEGGTGNFGGFKSGCTSNLIAADGVLAAPEYTRTCTCSYQNQTSLAMVHDPRVEQWTFSSLDAPATRLVRAGLNFAAPGDRLAPSGTLWLDCPSVGGPSPDLTVKLQPGDIRTICRHSSTIESPVARRGTRGSPPLPWVAASGIEGVSSIEVALPGGSGSYVVRLVFAEIDGARPGERVFDVAIQGKAALRAFDIARAAGGTNRPVVKEFRAVRAGDSLTVTLAPRRGSRGALICGLEIIRGGVPRR